MPHEPTIDIRLNNIIACLDAAIPLLNNINDAFGTPFVQVITNTTLSLITRVQKVKRNKEDCVRLMENIHELLYAVIKLHIKSETGGSLLPTTLDHIGKFTDTLHKIHMFIEVQQDGNKFKHFLRQHEISTLLKDCHEGLQQTLDVFKMDTIVFNDIIEMKKTAENTHNELLEMISSLSDGTLSDRSSSNYTYPRVVQLKVIFYVAIQAKDIPWPCLPGGSSGTGARKEPYKASASLSLQQALLPPYFDNLETPWEPKESRGGVEEFLSLLADIKHLALIITMRGAQRPAKVRWTRPFLQPLEPLTDHAAWQTFIDIADDCHENKDIKTILHLTDNMPLAVDLIAHLVDAEGCTSVLSRWETERTTLLSDGHDKQSSLDASIALSLSSPRMSSPPGAKDLLSLLSILPDGLSDVELIQSNLPIQEILGCKATLLGTSLAYTDDSKRLRSLVPIREHVLQFYPPLAHLIQPLQKHFHMLLDLYQRYRGQVQITSTMAEILVNLGNLRQVLQRGLDHNNPNLSDAIECTMALNSFSRLIGHGWLDLMDFIPSVFPEPCDHKLEARFIVETFCSRVHRPIITPELLMNQAISHFNNFNDPTLESSFYSAAGDYFYFSRKDPSTASQFLGKALRLAKSSGNPNQQSLILHAIASISWHAGDYHASWTNACEAQRFAQVSANYYDETRAIRVKAVCCMSLGDYKQTMVLLDRGRDLLMICGLYRGSLDFYNMNLEAEVHMMKSEYVQARRIHAQVLRNTAVEQNPYKYVFPLLSIAEVDVMIGACKEEVHQNLNKAEAILETVQLSLEKIYCEAILGDLHLRDRDTAVAKILFQKCFNSSWGRLNDAVSYCLERLADVSRWRPTDFDWSSQWAVVYLGHAKITQAKLALHKALQFLGDMFLCIGDKETAHSIFIVALEGFTFMDVHRSRANCMIRLGDLEQHRGQLSKAVKFWRDARPLFELSSQTRDVAEIDARLSAANQTHQKALAQLVTLNAPLDTLSNREDTDHLETEEGRIIHRRGRISPVLQFNSGGKGW
ncbi:hypothetical protein FB451DRAFT_1490663 [Mycena latifolia]|nr:hypothetical protein FB451DRAFT_1490663 [Mycena latifolia]